MVLPSSNSRQAQAAAPASKGRGATAGCGPSIWVGIFSLGKWANWLTDARARQNGLNLCTYVQKGNWRTCVRAATLIYARELAYVRAGGDSHSALLARAAGEHAVVRWIGGGSSKSATPSSRNRPAARHDVGRGHGDGAARTAVARRVSVPPVLAWACMHMIQQA